MSDDCISRQAAISDIQEMAEWHTEDAFNADRVIQHLKDLPPVNPQPKTGHWIYKQYGGYPEQGNYHCSECDNIDNRTPAYCPHCGCRMVKPQKRSDKE